MKVISESKIKTKRFGNVDVKELINTEMPSISIAKIELDGKNENNKHTVSNMYYYVLEGEGFFVIDGKKFPVKKGDLVCIPKGTVYHDEGKLKMISIGVPRFDAKNVVFAE